MAVTPINYTRKSSDIQAVKVDGDEATMEEIRVWVASHYPLDYAVWIVQGRTLIVEAPNGDSWFVNRGQHIGKDANNKLFKMDDSLLNALFDATS